MPGLAIQEIHSLEDCLTSWIMTDGVEFNRALLELRLQCSKVQTCGTRCLITSRFFRESISEECWIIN